MTTDRLDEATTLLREAGYFIDAAPCVSTLAQREDVRQRILAFLRTPATPPPASCATEASGPAPVLCADHRDAELVMPGPYCPVCAYLMAFKDGTDSTLAAYRASKAAPAASEAVAWGIRDVHGDFRDGLYKRKRDAEKDAYHYDDTGSARSPHTVTPLYTHPTPRAEAVVEVAEDGCPDDYGKRHAARCVNGPETERVIEGAWGDGYIAGQRAAVRKYHARGGG